MAPLSVVLWGVHSSTHAQLALLGIPSCSFCAQLSQSRIYPHVYPACGPLRIWLRIPHLQLHPILATQHGFTLQSIYQIFLTSLPPIWHVLSSFHVPGIFLHLLVRGVYIQLPASRTSFLSSGCGWPFQYLPCGGQCVQSGTGPPTFHCGRAFAHSNLPAVRRAVFSRPYPVCIHIFM